MSDTSLFSTASTQETIYQKRFFTFALEYATMKVQTAQAGLKFNASHQLLVYAGVNFNDENIQTILESRKAR